MDILDFISDLFESIFGDSATGSDGSMSFTDSDIGSGVSEGLDSGTINNPTTDPGTRYDE